MAGYFKKRKRTFGPSKNEKKVMRAKEAASAGTLGQRYQDVRRLNIQLKFSSPHNAILGEESRDFGPQDLCRFLVPCPGACGEGSFDLESKIQQIVATRQSRSESSGQCQKPSFVSPSDICGCLLDCTITVVY